jgi:hypothetical protein
MKKPSNGRHPLSCRARYPSARLRQGRWSRAYVSVYGVPRPSAVSRMLGLNEANVNIFSWTPPAPGSDKPRYVNQAQHDRAGLTLVPIHRRYLYI